MTTVEIVIVFLILGLGWFWHDSMRARETGVRAVRAACSAEGLQLLDETIAIYLARLLGTDYHLAFIKNGPPMVPLTTLQAGYRLMMHGLDCEGLHGWLREMKRRGVTSAQAAALVR